jgi:hypothetical protein
VLVREFAPAEVGRRLVGLGPVHLRGVDALRPDRAHVFPAIAQVELVRELLAKLQARQGRGQ